MSIVENFEAGTKLYRSKMKIFIRQVRQRGRQITDYIHKEKK